MIDGIAMKKKLENLHKNIGESLKSSEMIRKGTDARVELNLFEDMSGSVSIRSYLSEEMEKDVIPRSRELGLKSDVLLLMCNGKYSLKDNKIAMNCAIKNEDGIPLSMMNGMKDINLKVNSLAVNIMKLFEKL